jgi:hypothetical protein
VLSFPLDIKKLVAILFFEKFKEYGINQLWKFIVSKMSGIFKFMVFDRWYYYGYCNSILCFFIVKGSYTKKDLCINYKN